MKRLTKKTVRIAFLLCLSGLLIVLVSFLAVGFDMTKLSTVAFETNTQEINEAFTDIAIETKTADVSFVLWEEEGCKVVCREEAWMKHTAAVQNDTLVITITDTRKWYDHIGMSFEDAEMTIYLPKTQYGELEIKSDTGAVEVPEVFEFETATVETDTGDVDWQAAVARKLTIETDTGAVNVDTDKLEKLEVKTSTGDVSVNSVRNALSVSVETNTGATRLNNIRCRIFAVKSDTGDIRMKDTVAGFNGTVISQTGGVTLENSDAVESLYIKTDTGDVTGTLLSGKLFQTETDTGNVDVPATNGYPCVIITDTGDIDIEVIGK